MIISRKAWVLIKKTKYTKEIELLNTNQILRSLSKTISYFLPQAAQH